LNSVIKHNKLEKCVFGTEIHERRLILWCF